MTVKELAEKLCTTEERIRWFGKSPAWTSESEVTPFLQKYIYMRHLMCTHPMLFAMLSCLAKPNLHFDYERWLRDLRMVVWGQTGGQHPKENEEMVEK